jgi:predicted protein tyrosine phosphatase
MGMNRMWNIHNQYQMIDKYKRVLVCCSVGLLRSPTVARILANDPFNFNTRAVGLDVSFALITIDPVLLSWCDEVIVMDFSQKVQVEMFAEEHQIDLSMTPISVLDIEDNYSYNDCQLIEEATRKCREIFLGE